MRWSLVAIPHADCRCLAPSPGVWALGRVTGQRLAIVAVWVRYFQTAILAGSTGILLTCQGIILAGQ